MGSGELIQTLMRHGLIDEYLLLIHPLVLGSGRRLFGDGGPPASLRLVDSTVSTTGVLIATYQTELGGRTRGPIRDLRRLSQRGRRVALGPVGMGYTSDARRPPPTIGRCRFGREGAASASLSRAAACRAKRELPSKSASDQVPHKNRRAPALAARRELDARRVSLRSLSPARSPWPYVRGLLSCRGEKERGCTTT